MRGSGNSGACSPTGTSRRGERWCNHDDYLHERAISGGTWSRPRSVEARDCDDFREAYAEVDFEHEHLEKVLDVLEIPAGAREAWLWVYGQPWNFAGAGYVDREDYCLTVNHEPVLTFDVAARFLHLEVDQWVPFEIPLERLVIGKNTFSIYELHDPEYRTSRPWTYNNLRVGIDTDRDLDRSWWLGGKNPCCLEQRAEAERAAKPLARSSEVISGHREQGYRECRGELMIFLELRAD